MGLLNSSEAGLGNPGPTGVVLMFNTVRFISLFASVHFFIVPFMKDFACPVLCW